MTLASIETIKSLKPHPNADKLEVATVLGYDCIVPLGKFAIGQRVVLIQPDTVLPKLAWSEVYRKFCSTRVKALKLRGAWSFGIIEDFATFPDLPVDASPDRVAAVLGVTKYDPPQPQDLSALGPIPSFIPKTDEERWQNLEALPFGETVDVTLKIDGQSCSYYCVRQKSEWRFGVLGRTLEFRRDGVNPYVKHVESYDIETKLRDFCEARQISVCLRGESYGSGIQSSKVNPHSKLPPSWAMFGVWIIDERRYARCGDPLYFARVAKELGLPHVPIVESQVPLTPELVKRYDSDLTAYDGQPFEGVVINTSTQSFKVINKHYDSLK